MLFAGFAVAGPRAAAAHHLTLVGIVLAGVLGNLVGSWIAYGVGRAGRLELIERHGHWLHLKPSHIAWADRWFARYGAPAIFFSRMLPIIRTFISLPGGRGEDAVRALHRADAGRDACRGCSGWRWPEKRSGANGKTCARASSTSTTRWLYSW